MKRSHCSAALVEEMQGAGGEQQVAWRGGRRYVCRLQPLTLPAAVPEGPWAVRVDGGAPGEVTPCPRPALQAGEVLVRTMACGLLKAGSEGTCGCCAGVVEALGAEVATLRVGDEVVSHAGEYPARTFSQLTCFLSSAPELCPSNFFKILATQPLGQCPEFTPLTCVP